MMPAAPPLQFSGSSSATATGGEVQFGGISFGGGSNQTLLIVGGVAILALLLLRK